jgi:hypothetical protein
LLTTELTKEFFVKQKQLYIGLFLLLILLTGWMRLQAADSVFLPVVMSSSASGTVPTATTTPAATLTPTATPQAAATATPTVTPVATGDASQGIVTAANAFLATLSSSEQEAVLFDWTDTAQKQRWSNLPQGLYTRAGLMWGNLSDTQKNAWLAVMQATLSSEGYNRVIAQWNADDLLAGGGGCCYGTQYYWIAIIGTPSTTTPWQWQWGGHHVTINATIAGANLALYPSFIGVQPGSYTSGSNTVRPLGDIIDEAFALVNSLDSTQKATAVLGSSPIDLVLGPGQDGKVIASEGLPAAQMTEAQKTAFLQIIGHYTAARLAEIQATLSETYFAWYGPTTAGSAAYFRITGPKIVVEYAPQSMGGNAANHTHGIYRDPSNDYGAAWTSQ